MPLKNVDNFLRDLFNKAVASADPGEIISPFLPAPPKGRTIVLGAGKASAAMAAAVEKEWNGPLEGLVVTRYDHAVPCDHIEIVEAAHPVPDQAGLDVSERIYEHAASAGPEDLVLCLISGGGSSLLTRPASSISFKEKREINQFLLRCGANIAEMNCVRKHLSGIKGGRLALAAAPAKVVTLLISDVPGDDPSVIASGPTVPDTTTREEALEILRRYGATLPASVQQWLSSEQAETPSHDHPVFEGLDVRMIATPQQALKAAADEASKRDIDVHILGDAIEGEAREVAVDQASFTQKIRNSSELYEKDFILLSGGETTVTLKGRGRGGRNVEFLLALAIALDGACDVWALAADTDGVDGIEEIAGAIISPNTLARAQAMGLNPQAMLDDNDAHSFFEALGDQIITGPTLTNVNDFRAIYIGSQT